jgi:peptidoglycan glycosyltransferase
MDEALGRSVSGNDVVLTIDSRIQKAAQKALSGHRGAVVAIDPSTGAVLALASSPTFDPATVEARWTTLSGAKDSPLLDRAISSLYPPGSTFKVVTLTKVISSGVAGPTTVLPAPSVLKIGGGRVTNFEGAGYGSATLQQATRSSINTVYAQLGVQLGPQRLVEQARGFGFDADVPFELNVRPSLMPAPETMTTWETAWAAVGQPVGANAVKGPVVTALQMAMVASGVANGGSVMRPYLVQRVADPAGATVSATSPRELTRATDPATADTVRKLMVDVVKNGSGARAAISGVTLAGKTGTAEVGKSVATNAWFIAFGPAGSGSKPRIAMAIVLENAGVGGRVAAPAARQVLLAALKE